MEWSPEIPKITANIQAKKFTKDKAVDALVLTPGTIIAGQVGGNVGSSIIPTGLSKEKIEPMSKAKKKMLDTAIKRHKMDPNIKVVTGRKALKTTKNQVPNAQAHVDLKKYEKALANPDKKVRYLKNQSINIPQGANIEAAMHELGHLKHHQKPYRHLASSLAKVVGKPVGAVGAVAGMMHEDTAKYVPIAAPLAMYGSTIGTEGGANLFAVNEMRRQKGFKAGLKAMKKLSPYMATYLAAPLAVGGALYGLKKKIHG